MDYLLAMTEKLGFPVAIALFLLHQGTSFVKSLLTDQKKQSIQNQLVDNQQWEELVAILQDQIKNYAQLVENNTAALQVMHTTIKSIEANKNERFNELERDLKDLTRTFAESFAASMKQRGNEVFTRNTEE